MSCLFRYNPEELACLRLGVWSYYTALVKIVRLQRDGAAQDTGQDSISWITPKRCFFLRKSPTRVSEWKANRVWSRSSGLFVLPHSSRSAFFSAGDFYRWFQVRVMHHVHCIVVIGAMLRRVLHSMAASMHRSCCS